MSYLDSANGTVHNLAYWMRVGLDDGDVRVLRRVRDGEQAFARNRMEVAYLISLDCVEADLYAGKLTITDKGRDALALEDDT